MPGHFCIAILTFLLLIRAGSVQAQLSPADSAVLFTVDGSPVTTREFLMVAAWFRAGVIALMTRDFGIPFDNGFWLKDLPGGSPADILRQKTLDTLVKIRIQQAWAQQAGLTGRFSYGGFLQQLESENRRREEAVRTNRVIYGPVKYTEPLYYQYLYTNMVTALVRIVKEELSASGSDALMKAYEIFRNSHCRYGKVRTVKYSLLKQDERIPGSDPVTPVQPDLLTLNDTVPIPEGDDLKILIRQVAVTLTAGETSQPVHFGNSLLIVTIVSETDLGYRSPELCQSRLLSIMAESEYDALVEQAFKTAVVRIDRKRFYSVTF